MPIWVKSETLYKEIASIIKLPHYKSFAYHSRKKKIEYGINDDLAASLQQQLIEHDLAKWDGENFNCECLFHLNWDGVIMDSRIMYNPNSKNL